MNSATKLDIQPKSLQRMRMKKRLAHGLRILARAIFALVVLLLAASGMYAFENHMQGVWELQAARRDRLKGEHAANESISFTDPQAEARGKELLAVLEPLKDLGKAYPSVLNGVHMRRFVEPGIAVPASREGPPPFIISDGGKQPGTWQELQSQVETGSVVLAGAAGILSEPVRIKYEYASLKAQNSTGQLLPYLTWLRTSAILKIQRGDLEGALEDIALISKVADLLGEARTLVRTVLKMGAWSFGLSDLFWEFMHAEHCSDEQLDKLGKIAIEGNAIADACLAMEVEQQALPSVYRQLESSLGRPGTWIFVETPNGFWGSEVMRKAREFVWPFAWSAGDQARAVSGWNRALVPAGKLLQDRDWSTTSRELAAFEDIPSNYDTWRYPFATTLAGSNLAESILRSAVRVETMRELTVCAIALERYFLRHGSYPENLSQLVPEFLPRIPHDWYDGKPLKYRLPSKGAFLLYSSGQNKLDDGGDPTPMDGQTKIGMTGGKDIVWPH